MPSKLFLFDDDGVLSDHNDVSDGFIFWVSLGFKKKEKWKTLYSFYKYLKIRIN